MVRRIFLAFSPVLLMLLMWAQPQEKNIYPVQLPREMQDRLDSLKAAENLEEWLYVQREYVSEDPVNRIQVLTNAQSGIWRECRTDAERTEFFNCLATQGYYLMYNGKILRSIDAYEKAYRFYFEKPVPDENILEFVLKPLGNNYTRLGDYDRAAYIHEKALSLSKGKEDSASVYNNLAIAELSRGELDMAGNQAAKGLGIVSPNSSLHGLLLATFADILFRQHKLPGAESNILMSISVLKKHTGIDSRDAAYWLLSAYRIYADILAEKNDIPAAMRFYKNAISIIDTESKGERKREKAQVLISMGGLSLKMNHAREAEDLYSQALSLLLPSVKAGHVPSVNDLYGEYTLLDALHGKADCLSALNRKDEALQYYLLFFSAQKKLRSEFFSNEAKQLQQKDYRNVMESAIETAYSLWKKEGRKEYADKILLMAEMSKAQLLLDEMRGNLQYSRLKNQDTLLEQQQQLMQAVALYEREAAVDADSAHREIIIKNRKEMQFQLTVIQRKVKNKYPFVNGADPDELLPVHKLLQNLPGGLEIIEFFTGENGIYIIEASGGSIINIAKLDSSIHLRRLVSEFMDSWFRNGPDAMINEPQKYFRNAFEIYQKILGGLLIKEGKCILIPDGLIGYLPFDGLVTDTAYRTDISEWPFLVKKRDMYYAYSLQTWQQQQQVKQTNRGFAGFFISFDSSNASLPAVQKESEVIEQTIRGRFYKDQRATMQQFNKILNDADILHISTHSFMEGKNNIPVLQFADNKFFLSDLYGKAFKPRLVVLSACRTGHGILAEGEGVISLARGFTAAGSGGIVAGLWDMNDESTAALMKIFYSELSKLHLPAAALHAAKMNWLQHDAQNIQKLPYFWAGLTYSGGNSAVIVDVKHYRVWWWAAALITALLVFIGLTILTRNKK